MVMRKGELFRVDKLSYPEIGTSIRRWRCYWRLAGDDAPLLSGEEVFGCCA